MSDEKGKTAAVVLTPEIAAAVEAVSRETGATQSEVIRRALAAYFKVDYERPKHGGWRGGRKREGDSA